MVIILVVGLPRAGKSTYSAVVTWKEVKRKNMQTAYKLSFLNSVLPWYKFFKAYDRVLSNCFIDGAYQLDFSDIGKYRIKNSLLILDEAAMHVSNRNFKNLDEVFEKYLYIIGHDKNDVIFISQSDDIDKKIVDRCEKVYFIKKIGPQFSLAIQFMRQIVFSPVDGKFHFGFRMPNGLEKFLGFLFPFLGYFKFFYRPKYYPMFNSYQTFDLPEKEFKKWVR